VIAVFSRRKVKKMSGEENPFVVLGVPTSASIDEVATAWREKAKGLHPDKFPHVSKEITELLNREMARINSAYTSIKNDPEGQRRRFSAETSSSFQDATGQATSENPGSRHRAQRGRVPSCDLCGSLNTDQFEFSRQIGLIIVRRYGSVSSRMCQSCALAIGRDFQSRTLTTGWWGLFAFITNIGYIAKNTRELRRALKLSDPAPPSGFVTFPLDEGKPVVRRVFSWIGPVAIAVFLIISASEDSSTDSNQTSSNRGNSQATWTPGNCVSGVRTVVPVRCSELHNGRITRVVTFLDNCPLTTDFYVTRDQMYYCIDEVP